MRLESIVGPSYTVAARVGRNDEHHLHSDDDRRRRAADVWG